MHFRGETLSVRRITLCLDRPTESGDTEIHLITNLPAERATAQQVAQAYGTRWTVEKDQTDSTSSDRWCAAADTGYHRCRRAA